MLRNNKGGNVKFTGRGLLDGIVDSRMADVARSALTVLKRRGGGVATALGSTAIGCDWAGFGRTTANRGRKASW